MNRMLALAMLTFKEGIRERAMYGISIIAVSMLFLTILFTGLFGHDLGKVLVDLNLSTIAFAGLLMTFFVNINLIAKDIDKRTIYCVLSKPISRTEYIVGKYMGLLLLVFVSITLLSLFSSGIMYFVKSLYEHYFFRDFSWSCYFQAYVYEMLMFCILNGVIIFYSSITSSSFITLLLSVATYITGQTIEEVVLFLTKEATEGDMPSHFHQMLINGAQFVFPNFSAFDIKVLASHGKLLSNGHTLAIFAYSIAYTAVLLFFASIIFNRREFN